MRTCFVGAALLAVTWSSAVALAQNDATDRVVTIISRQQPGFRLATMSDFSPLLSAKGRGEVFVQADFNSDGLVDSAVLVVNDAAKEYRVYLLLGGHDDPELLFSRKWTQTDGHPIRTPMFLKNKGEAGIALRKYSLLNREGTGIYISMPAVEVWTGVTHDERDTTVEDFAYCSTSWYYDHDEIAHFKLDHFDVCD